MKTRRLLILLAATVALALATVGAAFAAPSRQGASSDSEDVVTVSTERPYLGMQTRPVTDRVKEYFGLPDDFEGVVVTGVDPRSPAAQAPMHLRDVVYRANGHDITAPGHLVRVVNSMSPGDVLTLEYVRQGERGAVDIVLGAWSDAHTTDIPQWLRKLHHFLGEFPNTVDATVNVLGEDGAIHQYVVTPGSLVRLGNNAIAVTKRGGATVEFQVHEDTVVVKHGERVRLADLAIHDRVVVLEKDGVVKALVVGLLQSSQPRPALQASEGRSNAPHIVREQAAALREHLRGIVERAKEERAQVQRPDSSEQAIERLKALKALHPELAERIDSQIAKMRAHMERMEQRLMERTEKAS